MKLSSDGVAVSSVASTSATGASWKHVIATYDGANIRIHVDGVLEGTTAMTGILHASSRKLTLAEVAGFSTGQLRRPRTFEDMSALCGVFGELDLFLWLQRKFPPGMVVIGKGRRREFDLDRICSHCVCTCVDLPL